MTFVFGLCSTGFDLLAPLFVVRRGALTTCVTLPLPREHQALRFMGAAFIQDGNSSGGNSTTEFRKRLVNLTLAMLGGDSGTFRF